jgi:hypothetical protein
MNICSLCAEVSLVSQWKAVDQSATAKGTCKGLILVRFTPRPFFPYAVANLKLILQDFKKLANLAIIQRKSVIFTRFLAQNIGKKALF